MHQLVKIVHLQLLLVVVELFLLELPKKRLV